VKPSLETKKANTPFRKNHKSDQQAAEKDSYASLRSIASLQRTG